MVGSVVQRLAPDADAAANGTNGTTGEADALDAYRVHIASSFAVLTGVLQVPASVLALRLTSAPTA